MGPDEYIREVMTTMKKFREQNILCDTILVTDDREIWAHSVVLAAVSPVLCSTFNGLGGSQAKKTRYNVSLPGCSASAVELVLQFLYSGQLAMPLIYQEADKFSRILFVCKSLGIDVGKLNGARVIFESNLERTAAVAVDHWVDACSFPTEAESTDCDGQLCKIEDNLSECEPGVSSFPSTDDISMNDLPYIRQNTAHDSNNSSADAPIPFLFVTVPVVPIKPLNNSGTSAVKNTTSQILSLCNAAKLATRRNSIKKKPARITRSKQWLTEVTLKDVRSEDKKDLLLTNNDASIPRSGKSEDHADIKPFPSLVEMFKSDCDDVLKNSVEACEESSANKLTVGKDAEKGERKVYSCLTCGKVFLRPRCFRKHVQSHAGNGKPLVCDKCGKTFTTVGALKVHQKAHIDGFPHVCEVCGKGYKFKRYLLIHTMTHTGAKPYLCDTCGRGFYVITNLKRHVLIRHTSIRPYVCGICGKGFITRQRLARHEDGHSGERPFSCEICGSLFRYSGNLSRHRMLHTGEKPYVCPVCLRAFTQKVTMQNHMSTHADLRTSFVCPICGKALKSKPSNLKKHVQMHSQHKPHVCEVCGKCFAVKDYLSRHTVIHKEKTYACETCKKGFRSKHSLLKHSKAHSVIPCEKCGKEFAGPKALKTHMRSHLEEENFLCKVCGKGFELQTQFDAHSKLHLR